MPDEHYENPKLAAIYDRFCGWSRDRDFYLALAGDPPQHVLDLGCGTGLLCDAGEGAVAQPRRRCGRNGHMLRRYRSGYVRRRTECRGGIER